MTRQSLLLVVAALAVARSASAEMSNNVISTFRGQLVVSKEAPDEGKTDKETIAKIKAAQVKELVGKANDEVTIWHFHYTAFLTSKGASSLKLEFEIDDKDHRYVANKMLDGVDPKSGVLSGDITIDEDEGLARGKTYIVQLVTEKEAVLAKSSVTFK